MNTASSGSRLTPKTVLITGASSGIGAGCARVLAREGMRLVLVARRSDRLQALAAELATQWGTSTYCLALDVGDRAQVSNTLSALPADWSDIDILINNAGLSRGLEPFQEASIDDWEEMIDTNLKGLLYVTRTLLPRMIQRGQGHIVNIGSIAGHQTYPKGHVYCATKAAVRALSEGINQDVLGTPIRVSAVDPGMVETEFSQVRFHGDVDRAAAVYQGLTPLTADDVDEVVLFCITRPAHVTINEVVVMPTDQASPWLVNRRSLDSQ